MNRFLAFWLLAVAGADLPLLARSYDLIIRNGRVIDGSGNPAYFADVAVKDRRIAAIGRPISGEAKEAFDAAGLVIAPGFIDVHTHAEGVLEQPKAENFLRMGVTTVVVGNCGGSRLKIGDYFRKLESHGMSPNVASLIGHGTVRREAMRGSFDRPPTAEELERMREYVDRAMRDGAVGLSTGLIYLPGVFARTDEIIELAKVVSKYGGLYATHQRNEGSGILKSLDEVFRVAREAQVRAEVSHIKLSGRANWGRTAEVLAALEKARAEGLDITQDQYAYTASSTGISQLIPSEWREGGRDKFVQRMADPQTRSNIVAQMKASLQQHRNPDYAYAVIASCLRDRSLNGLNIAEAARKVRGSDSLDDQIELVLDLEKNGGASGIFHSMNEEDVLGFLRHPNTMIGCDAGVRAMGAGVPHPRGYGNNARVLARYVREKHALRLEDAIRKMTSLPANTFQFKDRGELREGNWADITVFNPDTVQDNSVFNDPHHYSTGFKYVFVNGTLVIQDDRHTGAHPGRVLRHRAR